MTDPGLRTRHLVEFVDMFPTLVEAAGFPALELCPELSNTSLLCTEGSSLLPLLQDPDTPGWKEAVFWQYPRGGRLAEHVHSVMGYTIRTEEWRYTEWVSWTNVLK
jgi:iduronate 2-sulfatase